MEVLFSVAAFIRGGAVEQDGDWFAARGHPAAGVVEARENRLAGRVAAGTFFRAGLRSGHVDGISGEISRGRERRRMEAEHYRAFPYSGPGRLVLCGQALVAGKLDVYLSPLANEHWRLVAVFVSGGHRRGLRVKKGEILGLVFLDARGHARGEKAGDPEIRRNMIVHLNPPKKLWELGGESCEL